MDSTKSTKMANMFLLKHFDGNFPVNLEKMMHDEGILFDRKDIKPYAAIINSNISLIQISNLIKKELENFVIAYSIGHLLLSSQPKNILIKDLSTNKNDPVHNSTLNFAINLIMPETKFKQYCHSINDIDKIAAYFSTSSYIVKKRGEQLKIKYLIK